MTDGGTTNDNTPLTTGDPDYYVSFAVPFADVVSFLNSKSIVINENSGLRYVVATSTQGNSLNQDLGGVNGGINSTTSWEALGGFSPNISAGGQIIPEASSTVLITIGGLLACSYRRRK